MKLLLLKRVFWIALFVVGLQGTAHALSISLDLDPTLSGIQSSLTVAPGDVFTSSVVVTGDGSSLFTVAAADVAFNDSGSVLAYITDSVTAGSIVETAPYGAVDFVSGLPIDSGDPLLTDFVPTATGYSGGIGGVGIEALPSLFPNGGLEGQAFVLLPDGITADLFHLSFTVIGGPGTSSVVAPFEFFSGAGIFALGSDPVPASIAPGVVTVASSAVSVPEPSTFILFAAGIVGLLFWKRQTTVLSL